VKTLSAPFIGIIRHRMGLDGKGIVTLAGFYGCPLRCRYCLNPQAFSETTKPRVLTVEAFHDMVKVDRLYHLATGGGVTFGGGEPLLYAKFIRAYRQLCGPEIRLCLETSLHASWEAVAMVADTVDHFYIDIKDCDPAVYLAYTGRDNAPVLNNLRRLAETIATDRVTVRLPLIPGFHDEAKRCASEQMLRAMGYQQFDRFVYRVPSE